MQSRSIIPPHLCKLTGESKEPGDYCMDRYNIIDDDEYLECFNCFYYVPAPAVVRMTDDLLSMLDAIEAERRR